MFLWAMRPGFFALRAGFRLSASHFFFARTGRQSRPVGQLCLSPLAPPGGKKVTKKKRRPAGLFASLATLLELSSFAPISEGRGALDKNLEGVSTALCIQPRVFDTRLSNTHVPTLHYLMSIHGLTESNAN